MKIEFILSHYIGRTYQLIMAISSIIIQTNNNWTLHIICNGPVDDIEFIKNIFSKFPNIRYSVLDKHYDDFGHTPKNYGLERALEDWVVMGNDDNYYTPCFVDEILKSISKNPNLKFIYCDMIHNHYEYNLFKCSPKIGQIDMGNVITLTKLSQQIPLNIDRYEADGIFVETYISKFCQEDNIHHIPRIYFVHN